MKRIKGYTASETKQIEAFVAANRKDTRTWQERVLANMGHLSEADQMILRNNIPTDADIAAMEE